MSPTENLGLVLISPLPKNANASNNPLLDQTSSNGNNLSPNVTIRTSLYHSKKLDLIRSLCVDKDIKIKIFHLFFLIAGLTHQQKVKPP